MCACLSHSYTHAWLLTLTPSFFVLTNFSQNKNRAETLFYHLYQWHQALGCDVGIGLRSKCIFSLWDTLFYWSHLILSPHALHLHACVFEQDSKLNFFKCLVLPMFWRGHSLLLLADSLLQQRVSAPSLDEWTQTQVQKKSLNTIGPAQKVSQSLIPCGENQDSV